MAGFPERWLQELLQASDIASVVSEYVMLREKGGRLWGLCPFHNEKTASFSVSPDKQMYYCFGCHSGGNVIHFIMELEKISYVDTVKFLAERARLPMPQEMDDQALMKERALKEKCHAACREAALYYHHALASPAARAAREYLQKRGVDAATVKRFGLGYSDSGLSAHLTQKGFTREVMLAAGLSQERSGSRYGSNGSNASDGSMRDVFWNRLMFPIIGVGKQVIGFGGRVLGDANPKYLNTAENVIFSKRRHLYGLNFFRKSGFSDILLVEGYMDVVSLHQFGITNAVASLGTALTKQQALLIKRNAPRVYIAYDSDSAGQNAALKASGVLMNEGLQVRVMRFPDGQDPDDFIRKNGIAAFEEAKENALVFEKFKLSMLAKDYDLADENARELYAKAACAYIRTLEPLSQERYFTQISRETGFSLDALTSQGGLSIQGGLSFQGGLPSGSSSSQGGAISRNGMSPSDMANVPHGAVAQQYSASYENDSYSMGAHNKGYADIHVNDANSFSNFRNTRSARIREDNPERERTERLILCILVSDKDCALAFKRSDCAKLFGNKAYAAFADVCMNWHERTAVNSVNVAAMLDALEPEQAKLVSGALGLEKPENCAQVMQDCILRLKALSLRERMSALQKSREETYDKDEQQRLAHEYMALNEQLRLLKG